MSDPAASIRDEWSSVTVIRAFPGASGIDLVDLGLDELDVLQELADDDWGDPRFAIVRGGLQRVAPLEGRLDLNLLRLLLGADCWCQWVRVEQLRDLGENAAEVTQIASWLVAAGVRCVRLRAHRLELSPAELVRHAEELLDREAQQEDA